MREVCEFLANVAGFHDWAHGPLRQSPIAICQQFMTQTSQIECVAPIPRISLRSRLRSTWDGETDPLNDDGDQPGSGKKIDQI